MYGNLGGVLVGRKAKSNSASIRTVYERELVTQIRESDSGKALKSLGIDPDGYGPEAFGLEPGRKYPIVMDFSGRNGILTGPFLHPYLTTAGNPIGQITSPVSSFTRGLRERFNFAKLALITFPLALAIGLAGCSRISYAQELEPDMEKLPCTHSLLAESYHSFDAPEGLIFRGCNTDEALNSQSLESFLTYTFWNFPEDLYRGPESTVYNPSTDVRYRDGNGKYETCKAPRIGFDNGSELYFIPLGEDKVLMPRGISPLLDEIALVHKQLGEIDQIESSNNFRGLKRIYFPTLDHLVLNIGDFHRPETIAGTISPGSEDIFIHRDPHLELGELSPGDFVLLFRDYLMQEPPVVLKVYRRGIITAPPPGYQEILEDASNTPTIFTCHPLGSEIGEQRLVLTLRDAGPYNGNLPWE
jgi:hypothetical protein